MWIVRLALRLPYTSIVMALLMVIFGGVALKTMPTDIFPDIDIPVISVIKILVGAGGLRHHDGERIQRGGWSGQMSNARLGTRP